MQSGCTFDSTWAFETLKIYWLNEALKWAMRRSAYSPTSFGPQFTRRLRRKNRESVDTFFINEVFVKTQGMQHYLWRAIDQNGEVVDVFLQKRHDGKAAKWFFKRLLRTYKSEPCKIVTVKLRSYGVAHRELIAETFHDTSQYANNRAGPTH